MKRKNITTNPIWFFSVLVLAIVALTACGGKAPQPVAEPATQPEIPPTAFPTIPPEVIPTIQPQEDNAVPAASPDQSKSEYEVSRWGKGRIYGIAYYSNGKQLAVGTTLGVYTYDATSWEEQKFFDACPTGVYSLTALFSGDMIAAGCNDGTIQLWSASDGKLNKTLEGHTSSITSLAFSSDGQYLASGSMDLSVRIWKVADGSLVQAIEGAIASRVNGVALTSDGSTIAIALDNPDNQVLLWKLNAKEPYKALTDHQNAISDVVFSADNTMLASSSRDSSIILWNPATGEKLKTFSTKDLPEFQLPTETPDPNQELSPEDEEQRAMLDAAKYPFVFNLAFSPDGQSLAAGYFDNVVRIWRLSDSSVSQTLKGHGAPVFNLAFSGDGQQLVSRSTDGTVRVWQISDGSNVKTLDFGFGLTSIAYSPDGSKMALGGEINHAQVRKVSDGNVEFMFANHLSTISSVAYSPDGSKLATASIDGAAVVYNAEDGKPIIRFNPQGPVFSVAFSPDSQWIATGAGVSNNAGIWNIEKEDQKLLSGHSDTVYTVAYSPDGTLLASGGADKNVILWFVQDGRQLGSFSGHVGTISSLAFSPDGETLASGSLDVTIRLWKIPSGESLRTIQLAAQVTSLAYSPDGSMLAAGMIDGTIAVLPIQSENPDTPIVTLQGHKGEVTSVKFSPDQGVLTSASRDGTVRFWKIK